MTFPTDVVSRLAAFYEIKSMIMAGCVFSGTINIYCPEFVKVKHKKYIYIYAGLLNIFCREYMIKPLKVTLLRQIIYTVNTREHS